MTLSTVFAALAGILAVSQILPYTLSSIKGNTKPSPIASGISLTSNAVIAITMFLAGARAGMVLPIGFVFTGTITFYLAIKYGRVTFAKSDIINAGIAVAAIGSWLLLGPRVALVAMALANLTSVSAVFRKLLRHPGTEDSLSWVMVFVATCCSIIAILLEGAYDPAVLFVPIVGLVAFGSVAGLTLFQQRSARTIAVETASPTWATMPAPATALPAANDLVLVS